MIKVLIVDDDKLVRKGLISAMPWNEYGMEVVGEAKNGEKALEFLHTHQVDLLLADLAMPVMSGMELMRHARKLYPNLLVVVLTMHQDFEYIQEALRLGVIDYIAKVELERDSFGTVLRRIRDRIEEVRAKSGVFEAPPAEPAKLMSDKAWVLMADIGQVLQIDAIAHNIAEPAAKAANGLLWIWQPRDEQDSRRLQAELLQTAGMVDGFVLMRVCGVKGLPLAETVDRLLAYRQRGFFYDRREDTKMYELSPEALAAPPVLDEEQLNEVKSDGISMVWVHQTEEFERLTARLKALQLAPEQLHSLLSTMHTSWNSVFQAVTNQPLLLPASFNHWQEAEQWLASVRQQMLQIVGKSRFAGEVQRSVALALQFMHEQLAENVNAADIARKVGMSRGYFSQCFKDWTGVTFNEYMRRIRMEKAKQYLRYTNRTIAWIAEKSGYADEKYFSRTFRRTIGMLPSEYRQLNRQGGELSRIEGEK